MSWERWRIPVMLAPALTIILVLFVGALLYAFMQSLGWNPRIGATQLTGDAYYQLLWGRHAQTFWTGLALTLWVSLVSTLLSAMLAIIVALLIRQLSFGKKLITFLIQFNLPIPHVVAAIGILFLLGQAGLLSRGLANLGIITMPNQFPLWVQDKYGIGIIIAYVWKELPFISIIVIAALQALGTNYEEVAGSLGANGWQRLRYVTLPLIMPSVLSASIIVFAFTFGAYEVPAILGVRYPRMLPVTTLRFFRDPDLNARSEGMALSIIMAVIMLLLILLYMIVSRRIVRAT